MRGQSLEQLDFATQNCGTRLALRGMLFDSGALGLVQFAESAQDREILKLGAFDLLLHGVRLIYASPASCARNLRVARKSEFLTVSSVVPSASPIARSRNPCLCFSSKIIRSRGESDSNARSIRSPISWP